MTSYRYDPYLWVHLAGLATVPLWLDLCLLGLAVDYPTMPEIEMALVIVVGVIPVLLMQIKKPFYIFGLMFLALRPEALNEHQRKLLTLFRSWPIRLVAPLVSLWVAWCFLQLYQLAPMASAITPFYGWGRTGGLALAAVGLVGANLFLQVPVSALLVMATPAAKFQGVVPYPVEAIKHDFCSFGLPVSFILPEVLPPPGVMQPSGQPEPVRAPSAEKAAQPASKASSNTVSLQEQTSGVSSA